MSKRKAGVRLLMADDDPDDRLMAQKALEQNHLVSDICFVEDGEQLLRYLRHEGEYADPTSSPAPALILLDLNMPRKDGREALLEIKADPRLRSIPIVVMTTSEAAEDVSRSYDLGANSYITKPVTFEALVDVMGSLGRYWLDVVQLPRPLGPA